MGPDTISPAQPQSGVAAAVQRDPKIPGISSCAEAESGTEQGAGRERGQGGRARETVEGVV